MGSLFTPKVSAAPEPPKPVDYNVDDLIGGTKQRIVTQPDGSKTVVISENLTPEQQTERDNLKKMTDSALAKYQAMLDDPFLDTMPEYKAQVERIYTQQTNDLNAAYRSASKATEASMARYGMEDSTAASLERAQNTKNLAGAQQQLAADKTTMANTIRANEMANQFQAYGLASGRKDTLLSQGMQTLGLGNSIAMANAARNDNYQNQLFQNSLNYTNSMNQARSQGMSTLGNIIGTGAGMGLSWGMGGGFARSGISGGYDPRSQINWNSGRRGGI